MTKVYDVLIIGAGPAGLTAGMYAGRSKLSTAIFEGTKLGGQIVNTSELENYPGSIEEPSGEALINRMKEQYEHFGGSFIYENVLSIDTKSKIKKIITDKAVYQTKAIIIASGAITRPLGIENEEKFAGKGLSYCATCDAAFYEGLEVYVIGGGDAAVEEALYITKFAKKVTIVHRRDELRAAKSIQEKAFKNPKIEFIWDSVVDSLKGEVLLSEMVLKNKKTGEFKTIKASEDDLMFGVFVMIGYIPKTEIFKGLVDMNEAGYIIAGEDMQTNLEGVFVAGDCRTKTLRQVVTATSDGAIAAVNAEKYIEENFE